MKNLLFNLRVLYLSLKFPFWCMTIVLYSFIILYVAMASATCFVTMTTDYFNLNNWNEPGRFTLVVLTLFMSFIIISIRKKFFNGGI